MSADIMPCGCEGHADNAELCLYPALHAEHERLISLIEEAASEKMDSAVSPDAVALRARFLAVAESIGWLSPETWGKLSYGISVVYDCVTNGHVSKPNTDHRVVLQFWEEARQKDDDEWAAENARLQQALDEVHRDLPKYGAAIEKAQAEAEALRKRLVATCPRCGTEAEFIPNADAKPTPEGS